MYILSHIQSIVYVAHPIKNVEFWLRKYVSEKVESILLNIFIKNISQIQNVKLKGCSELSSFIHDIMVKSNWIPMPNYYPDITLPGIRLWLVTIILYCCNNQSWIYECKTSQQCPVFSPLQEVVRSTSCHVGLTSPEIGTRVISCHYKLHDTSTGDVNNFTLSPITTSITFDVFRLALKLKVF